ALNYSMFELAHGYAREGMTAYSRLQEKEFKSAEKGYTAVRHQRFVGTGYFDEVAQTIASGHSSTTALEGCTENEQFDEPAAAPALKPAA
ncbi:MAG: isocitrate lyase, partial [Candidatus Angelobacter sp.]